eukprot:5481905-Pyramimonas_sp.AAC.2
MSRQGERIWYQGDEYVTPGVNAGPVHSYAAGVGGRTTYLAELKSGQQVLIIDPSGKQRVAVVGRVKIEERPLLLVEAETSDGCRHSVLMQSTRLYILLYVLL